MAGPSSTFVRGTRVFLVVLLLPALAGCGVAAARRHSTAMNQMLQNREALEKGLPELEKRVFDKEGRVKDGAYTQDLLELGALYSQMGRFKESNDLLETVFWRYVEKEDGPVISLKDSGASLVEATLTSGSGDYRMANYEKVYLHAVKARNYLLMGDTEGAGVEVRRAYAIQRALREQVDEERAKAEEKKREKLEKDKGFASFLQGLDLGPLHARAEPADAGEKEALDRLGASYENPYAQLLGALVYYALGQRQDALIEARRAFETSPTDEVRELVEALEQGGVPGPGTPNVFVFVATDRGPHKEPFDLRFYNGATGAMSKISFPVIARNPALAERVTAGGEPLVPVADMDLLALKEYRDRLPALVATTALRFFSHTAKDAYLKKELGLAGRLIASVSNEVMEGADTRCWSAVPKRVYFGTTRVEDGQVDVQVLGQGGRMLFRQRFPVDPNRLNVIQVFSNPCTMAGYRVAVAPRGTGPVAWTFALPDELTLAAR